MDNTAILRQRDRASFDWLYNQYAAALFGIILRIVEHDTVAENLLKETFVDAWGSLDEFDETKGGVFIRMLRIARTKAAGYTGHGLEKEQTRKKKGVVSDTLASPATDRTERIFQLLKNGGQHEYSEIY